MGKKKKHLRNKTKNIGSVSSDGGTLSQVQKKNSVSVEKSDIALMMEGGASEYRSESLTPMGLYT